MAYGPNDKKRQAHLQFIQRNLDFLLAAGWAGFEQYGRGAILVDADRAVKEPAVGRRDHARAVHYA